MLSSGQWTPNQANKILFVLVDSSGNEVTGLGSGFTLQLSKAGSSFQSSAGTKAEIGSGWYSYLTTAGEADTFGPVAIKVTHASIVQQNLEYICGTRVVNSVAFTYTVLSTEAGNPPIEGVEVSIYTDSNGSNLVWVGRTDSFGVARDEDGELPKLQAGTYFFTRRKDSFDFANPDQETVG